VSNRLGLVSLRKLADWSGEFCGSGYQARSRRGVVLGNGGGRFAGCAKCENGAAATRDPSFEKIGARSHGPSNP